MKVCHDVGFSDVGFNMKPLFELSLLAVTVKSSKIIGKGLTGLMGRRTV